MTGAGDLGELYAASYQRLVVQLFAICGDLADAEDIASLFATHAAIALGHARDYDNLQTALATRKIIGQAIGILMERYDLDEDRAFAFLRRASSHSNVKLRDVAQELVRGRSGPKT